MSSIKKIEGEISALKEKLAKQESAYRKTQLLLNEKERELHKERLRVREVNEDQIMYVPHLDKDTRTVQLMDEFEKGTNENPYIRMIIKRPGFYYDNYMYYYVLERLEGREAVGDITMTEFKNRETGILNNYIIEQLNSIIGESQPKKGQLIVFDKPYHLRAQNSNNRIGYGSENYGGFYTQGTLYGETDDYCIAGVLAAHSFSFPSFK